MNTTIINNIDSSPPRAAFNLALCVITSTMAALFIIAASLTPTELIRSHSALPIILLIASIIAIIISSKTKNTWVSLITALIIPVALGVLMAAKLTSMPASNTLESLTLVGLTALGMFGLSASFPAFFKKIYGILIGALITLIIVGLLSVFFFEMNMTLYHIATIVIFSGLLGYDFVKAREVVPNVRNAIHLSLSLFLDLLNLYNAFSALNND